MNLKNIGKKIKRTIHQENKEEIKDTEQLVQENIIKPITEENLTVEQKAERIVEILAENPEEKEKIIQRVAEAEEISQDVVDTATVKAVDSSEVPDEVAVELAKKASDGATLYAMDNAEEISARDRQQMLATLEEQKAKERGVCITIRKEYNELVDLEHKSEFIGTIQNTLAEYKRTIKVNQELYRAVAKYLAMMYYKRNGALNISEMQQLVPLKEMIRVGMPEMIEEEYNFLLDDNEKNKFDIKEVQDRFLERLAKETTDIARQQNQPVEVFAPSDLGNISDEEVDSYIVSLTKYNPDLSEIAKENIRDKIQKSQEGYNIEGFMESVRQLSEGQAKRYFSVLSNLTPEEMDTVIQCVESGMIGSLSKKDRQERRKYCETINKSIEGRNQPKTETRSRIGYQNFERLPQKDNLTVDNHRTEDQEVEPR